jgi:hypothetical protein
MGVEIPSWLNADFYQECAFLTRLWTEAEKVMAAFDESNIEYIPLKGIVNKDFRPCTSNCIKGQNALYSNVFGAFPREISEKRNTDF